MSRKNKGKKGLWYSLLLEWVNGKTDDVSATADERSEFERELKALSKGKAEVKIRKDV